MGANAAILCEADAFDTTRPRLMGRHAAGEGFLKAFARDAAVERLYGYAVEEAAFRDFAARVRALAGDERECVWIAPGEVGRLAEVGCLFRPDPGIAETAWQRRYHGARAWSLCGVTHTTASAAVMDAIGALALAPVQRWDAVVCTSQAVRATVERVLSDWAGYLEARVGARPGTPVELPVIPLGVDCAALAPSPRSEAARAAIRARLGIGEADLAVLFLGRLSFHAKAHPLPMYLGLEEAARRSGRRLHLIQAGWFANDRIRGQFAAAARAFCPAVAVSVLDGRERAVREGVWFAADLFTSLADNVQETFGLAPLEAMAAGLPVVVSDWDGYRDTVRHGVDGFCVPTRMPAPGSGEHLAWRFLAGVDSYDRYIGHLSQTAAVDVRACAAAYAALVADTELRRRMGAAARARARACFDWPVVIGAYQALWADLARRRAAEPELAQPAAGAPAHPLRGDPYAVFAAYPSAPVADGDVVASACGPSLPAVLAHELNSFAAPVLASPDDCRALLARLGAEGPLTLARLLEGAPAERRATLRRTVAWLAKMGLVRFLPAEG